MDNTNGAAADAAAFTQSSAQRAVTLGASVGGYYSGVKTAVRTAGSEAVLVGASAVVDKIASKVPPQAAASIRANAGSAAHVAASTLEAAGGSYAAGTSAGVGAVSDALNQLFDKLPPEKKNAWLAQKQRLGEQKEALKVMALDASEPLVDKMIIRVRDHLKKAAISERDMPGPVRRFFTFSIDSIWPDITIELKQAMQDVALKAAAEEQVVGASSMPCCCSPLRWRAFFLYHYLPCDKGTWTKLKDPVYVLLKIATLVPVFGIRVAFHALLLLALTSPANEMDEYQLSSFVLVFKGSQFLAGGLIMALQGGLSLFHLTTYGSKAGLEGRAPGVEEGIFLQLVDFLGGVMLGWLALAFLPCSGRKGVKVSTVETAAQRRGREAEDVSRQRRFCGTGNRGGHLSKLLSWDIGMFVMCALLWVVLCAMAGLSVTDSDWRVATALFWCRIIYSLTTVPFFFFTLPGLSKILMHVKKTGFNRYGKCVPFSVRNPSSDSAAHVSSLDRGLGPGDGGAPLASPCDDSHFDHIQRHDELGDFRGDWEKIIPKTSFHQADGCTKRRNIDEGIENKVANKRPFLKQSTVVVVVIEASDGVNGRPISKEVSF